MLCIVAITARGKLVFHIFATLAEFERGVICKRTLAGLQATQVQGRPMSNRDYLK